MKKIIRITTVLLLAIISERGAAQIVSICEGASTVITAANSSGLSNPSYSLNPGGITSPNSTFAVSPATTTIYNLYVTGTNSNSQVVTTMNTVTVQVVGTSFNLASPQSFSLGCFTKSACTVQIQNAQSTLPPGGGAVSYTILPPGSSPSSLPAGTLSGINVYTMSVPGPWSVAVRCLNTGCTTWSVVNISQNVTPPIIGNISGAQNILTCTTPTTLIQVAPDPTIQYTWMTIANPGLVQGNNITFSSSPVSTQSLVTTLTLVATDINNICASSSVIPVYQNTYKPKALIAGPALGSCFGNTVALTNISTTGIYPGTFPSSAPVVAKLWEAPVPQPSAALTSTFPAQTVGQYTLTAMDMNNGCTSSTTYDFLPGFQAGFIHTIMGGSAIFLNTSLNAYNTNYLWNFGDGTTSTLKDPLHTYLNGGAYPVKLLITNTVSLCTDSIVQVLNISGIPCTANSNFSMVPTGTAQVWNVTPAYPWNVTAASWSWGDGSFSNTLYTSHQYSAAGLYTICLSVTVSCGNSSSACTSYSVYRVSQEAMILEVNVIAPELISGMASVDKENKLSWNIQPNPNSGTFHLDLNTDRTVHVSISDLTGRVLYTASLNPHSGSAPIHTNNLPKGMYFVTVESEGVNLTKRMVIDQ